MSNVIEQWRHDVSYARRSLLRVPAFSLAIILTLALGIGTNAAVFSFLDQVLFRPPPGVGAPENLKRVWTQYPIPISKEPFVRSTLAHHEFRAIKPALGGDAQLAVYGTRTRVPVGRDESDVATVVYATANYFAVTGAPVAVGRSFTEDEADIRDARRVVVISDAFWHRRFGGDRDVIGKSLRIDGTDVTVIGVGAPSFAGVDLQRCDLWLPLGLFPTRDVPRVSFWDSSIILFSAIARLSPNVNETVLAERASVAYRHAPMTDFPVSDSGQVVFRSIVESRGLAKTGEAVSIGMRIAIVAIIVLLLATANVINLLLARAFARQREVAVRMALGISRRRLIRLFLVESALLSVTAGAAALLLTETTGGLLRGLLLPGVEFAHRALGPVVAIVTTVLSLIIGLVAGLMTGIQSSRPDIAGALAGGARVGEGTKARLPRMLVATQAALCVMLLLGASLVVQSLLNVRRARIGFDVDRLAFATVTLPYGERADSNAFRATMRAVGDQLRRLPGVEAIAFARDEPMSGFSRVRFYTASDSSEGPNRTLPTASYVSGDYFRAIGLPFVRGATFSDEAPDAATAVVVNTALASTYWPTSNPIGQCIHIQSRQSACLTVLGVVEDAVRQELLEEPAPQLYFPIFQSIRGHRPPSVLVVRADPRRIGPVLALTNREMRNAFPRGVAVVTRMTEKLANQYRPWRIAAALFSAFGALALVVAALGIYSSVSYSVNQRVREIGVRMALGATASDVLGDVVGRGMRPVVTGGIVGILLTIPATRLMSALLYKTPAYDPLTLLSVSTLLTVVGVTAALFPGIRAARIDPLRAMSVD